MYNLFLNILIYAIYIYVCRNAGNGTYQATTWQIVFSLKAVIKTGNYTFRMALAAATTANLSVRINEPKSKPIFLIGLIGQDNTIARHGIHGLYNLYDINVGGNLLRVGNNTIFLTQDRRWGSFTGVMYDYLRLESPPEV